MTKIRLKTIGVDCIDPTALATWWGRQLEAEVQIQDEHFVTVTTNGLELFFVAVPDPTPGKNKMHFCLDVDNRIEAREALLGAGASLVNDHTSEDGFSWTTLADPEGNLFDITDPGGH